MENDMILSVKYPLAGVGGPYAVVHKDDKNIADALLAEEEKRFSQDAHA